MILKFYDMIAIESFVQQHATDKLSISVAFKLNKIMRTISDDLQFFREKYRNLIETCGEKDENGEIITLEDGNYKIQDKEAFEKGAQEIMTEEVVYSDLVPLKLSDLGNIQISMSELNSIMPIIEE